MGNSMYMRIKNKRRIKISFVIIIGLCLLPLGSIQQKLKAQDLKRELIPSDYLTPINTESPRKCLRSFMIAMDSYRNYRKEKTSTSKTKAEEKLNRAIKTLNLESVPTLLREQRGKEAAIYLKEVIDRITIIDYSQVPDKDFDSDKKGSWRLANTEIIIQRSKTGEKAGEYLFAKQTVKQAYDFYKRVRHLPYLTKINQGSGYSEPWFEKKLPEWFKKPFLSVDWWQWLGIFLAILIGFTFRTFFRYGLLIFLRILSKSKPSQFGLHNLLHSIVKPLSYLVAIIFWFLSLLVLQLQEPALTSVGILLKLFLSICLIWLAYQTVNHFSSYLTQIAFRSESRLDDQLAPLLSRSLKILTLVAGVLLAVQNLGINIASVLAGLGLGGLAFALAARDTVANLFGSLMIIFDRPFQIGDWVKIKEAEGNVEDIGFRSTRIRTFYNSVISIPNSEVASSQIDNMGARKFRRVVANLSVTYSTTPHQVELFLEGIKNIIKANSFTRKDYYHVVFKEYGDSGLIIMIYFYLAVPDWSTELVERQNVYLEIYRLAKDLEIDFAFPTQSLHIESLPEEGKDTTKNRDPLAKDYHSEEYNQKIKSLSQIPKKYGKDGDRSFPRGLGIFTASFREK